MLSYTRQVYAKHFDRVNSYRDQLSQYLTRQRTIKKGNVPQNCTIREIIPFSCKSYTVFERLLLLNCLIKRTMSKLVYIKETLFRRTYFVKLSGTSGLR